MATYKFDKIEYSGNTYVVSDSEALPLTGGQVTGPVTFGDTVSIDEATVGDLVVNGSASFTNNIQANTISGDLTGDVTGNVVGNVSGSAGTAGAFTSAKSVTLTGDVTGSASSTGGWSVATTVKDDSHNHTADTIMVPKITKSYTGVIASANNHDNAALYCIKIVPDSYAGQWYLKYRVFANMDGVSDANGHGYEESYVYINGMRNTYASYRTWNNVLHTSYRPYYYHSIYRAKEAGATTYGHVMGINLYNSYNPTNTTYKRNVTFEILDYGGCTISFLDAPTKYASIPGTGSTNYDGRTDFDGSTQGNTMSGDRNTTTTYGYVDYYFKPYAGQALYRYKFVLQGEDNRVYPIVTTNQTDGNQVAKAPTTVGLKPWKIWFYNSTTTINAGAAVGNQTMLPATYSTGAAYSFNTSIAAYNMVYLRGTYDKDKDLFYLYNDGSSPCTSYYTVVPDNTANITLSNYFVSGYYYLLLGATYSSANYINLFNVNPLYYFDGTNLKEVNRIAPNWDENDSTSPSYIENRTHYRTSLGYSYPLSGNASWWRSGDDVTFGNVTKTYTYQSTNLSVTSNQFRHPAFDSTVTSVVASVTTNGTTTNQTLSVYVEDHFDEEYPYMNVAFYNDGYAFYLGIEPNGDEYDHYFYRIDINHTIINISDDLMEITLNNLNVPVVEEEYEYTKKLDNRYLNGKLIVEGTGNGSEIFNSSDNKASGDYSHAEGTSTTASSYESHAEGHFTTASGSQSHAEGNMSKALGNQSHAEGYTTIASGNQSHAEGSQSLASGHGSHAEGYHYQMGYTPIVISGAANTKTYTSTTTISSLPLQLLVGLTLTIDYVNVGKIISYTSNGSTLSTITLDKTINPNNAISNERIYPSNRVTESRGNYSHAEGQGTVANGETSHSEGDKTYAGGRSSHSEGYLTIASGDYSHAEGYTTTASGTYSHAEGISTVASGDYSHAEGSATTASSPYAHAGGFNTVAQRRSQHVFGEYNILDTGGSSTSTKGTYIEIVGKGTSTSARSNARTLDWSGNETLAGSITIGKGTADEVTLTPAKLKQLLALL